MDAITAMIEHSRPCGGPSRVHLNPMGCDSFTGSGGLAMSQHDAFDFIVNRAIVETADDPWSRVCRDCLTSDDLSGLFAFIHGRILVGMTP